MNHNKLGELTFPARWTLRWTMLLRVVVLLLIAAACALQGQAAEMHSTTPAASKPAVQGRFAQKIFIKGSFRAMKGDYWGAIEQFRKVMDVEPGNAAVHYAMAKAFSGLSVLDSARVYGENAVRLDPANKHFVRFLAETAHDMQAYERAAELYGRAAALDSGKTENLYLEALEYLAAEKPDKALPVFQEILKSDPENELVLTQVLLLEIKVKQYNEAIETTRKLLAGEGTNRERLTLTLGELYLKTGKDEQAKATYRTLISLNPRFVPAWTSLLELSVKTGNQQEFTADLRKFFDSKAIDVGKEIELARLFLIHAEKDTTYSRPASLMLQELTVRHSGDSRVHVLKGLNQLRNDQGAGAISSFRKAITIDPRNIEAWEELVNAYLVQKEYSHAFAAIVQAKRALPRQAFRFRVIEGFSIYKSGDPGKAAAILEGVVRSKQPKTVSEKHSALLREANGMLANIYDEMGRPILSLRAYERLLRLDPHNSMAMNNIAYMLAEQGSSLQRALKLATGAVSLEPDNGVYLDTLGWIYFRIGNYPKSRELLEKSLATGIVDPEIYRHLAKVYDKLGDTVRAKEMNEKAAKAPLTGKSPP